MKIKLAKVLCISILFPVVVLPAEMSISSWLAREAKGINGNLVELTQALESGDDVNWKNDLGRIRLMVAAGIGDSDIAEFLIEKRADVNQESKTGWSALMHAAHAGHPGLVRLLLVNEADPDTQNKTSGHTALALAARNGHVEVMKLLFSRKFDWLALKEATLGGSLEAVKLLLEGNIDANEESIHNCKALVYAAEDNSLDIVELLLRNNFNINQKNQMGQSALMRASSKGNLAMVELLLVNKANINDLSDWGRTALIWATVNDHEDIVELLLIHKADPGIQEKVFGHTALSFSVRRTAELEDWPTESKDSLMESNSAIIKLLRGLE